MKAGSHLEKMFAAGHFAVTGEMGPPRGADAGHIHRSVPRIEECGSVLVEEAAQVIRTGWVA